jgi:phage shock protein A
MEQIELSGSEICRMEIRNLNSELARVRTHSAAQADTVAELNGEIAELQNQIHEWEESDAAGEAFTAIIDRQQTEIARKDAEIAALKGRI